MKKLSILIGWEQCSFMETVQKKKEAIFVIKTHLFTSAVVRNC